ncbi:BTAD domain-containing putative transcriptional regulator [Thermomonospora cellulosilytica]|uniref:Putative ATPase/DNA-binding winged helix-turn-helix (WHTH) protein n=1 Tax=Thermomonospora cellulosilytica TaxID=1411118 RepID=A0A7W3N069_9ACTN|nr:BTAD domain-containing putative transcriptional regulator [Thermomonospora cellulosilytica]MBA9005062.1 putative ATPase/DNA-binding winged helix-turn-helix (wHTH) protein [Thermomonospora cellulosilytica]
MRFGVLGPLEVWTRDGGRAPIPEAKVRALLADLIVHDGRTAPAARLIDDLWGDRPPANPAGALQARVSQLRRALEDAEPGGRDLVVTRPQGYALQITGDTVDARRFADLTERARRAAHPADRAALLDEALGLWRGPAFADFADEEFARAAAVRLEEQRLAALEDRAEARLELGRHAALVGELEELLVHHPFRERLRAAHLRALYQAGRQSDALTEYARFRERLAEELGVDPGPRLVALHQAILRQDPALDPPARPARTNLPAEVTELIGRDDELAGTRALLAEHRMVTLTGPGGVGKTRLAIEVASRLRHEYPDGVWLVELATTTRPVEAVAAVLGVRDDEGPDLADRLAAALRTRRSLLVLDNCEHVVTAAAELADALLRAAPGVRILATSREPLGLAGERVSPVPPLRAPGPWDAADPSAITAFSAVRLFVARAAAAAPGFALDAGNAAAVAAICRGLDGLPLALELAATRVRGLEVHELAARLDDRFRLLDGGRRGGPARQRTLRAMIDWSWEPLTGPERAVLRRLAVHADGCTLQAAEAVCSGDGVAREDVADVLARLVDRSLASRTGGRYRLLESVAAYCVERLREAAEEDRVRRRHLHYYADLAERAASGLRGPRQGEWLERLDAESANVRTALDHAADADAALRLACAMAWYWFLRGRLGEGVRLLGTALALDGGDPAARAEAMTWQAGLALHRGDGTFRGPRTDEILRLHDDLGDPGRRAWAHWFLAFAHLGSGDPAANEERVDRALEGFRETGDRWGIAAALTVKARHRYLRGELTAAERDGRESLALFDALGDRWGRLQATDVLGILAEMTGDYRRAERLHRDGLRIAERFGLRVDASTRLAKLGRIAMLTGDHAEAVRLQEEARRLAAGHALPRAEQFAEVGLGMAARRQGRLRDAERHLNAWLDWCRGIDGDPGAALILAELGFVAELRGDAEAALALHTEGLEAARNTGDPRAVALALEGLAGAHALAGRPGRAARLLGTAAAAREEAGAPLPEGERGDVERITANVRAALGDVVFEEKHDAGRSAWNGPAGAGWDR